MAATLVEIKVVAEEMSRLVKDIEANKKRVERALNMPILAVERMRNMMAANNAAIGSTFMTNPAVADAARAKNDVFQRMLDTRRIAMESQARRDWVADTRGRIADRQAQWSAAGTAAGHIMSGQGGFALQELQNAPGISGGIKVLAGAASVATVALRAMAAAAKASTEARASEFDKSRSLRQAATAALASGADVEAVKSVVTPESSASQEEQLAQLDALRYGSARGLSARKQRQLALQGRNAPMGAAGAIRLATDQPYLDPAKAAARAASYENLTGSPYQGGGAAAYDIGLTGVAAEGTIGSGRAVGDAYRNNRAAADAAERERIMNWRTSTKGESYASGTAFIGSESDAERAAGEMSRAAEVLRRKKGFWYNLITESSGNDLYTYGGATPAPIDVRISPVNQMPSRAP